jgi:hypothetical protein
VASAALRRWLWPAIAATAGAFIATLALHGERAGPGRSRFEAAGLMVHVPTDRVRAVEVTSAAGTRRFRRLSDGRWLAEPNGSPDQSAQIEEALKFLHVTRPERVLTAQELDAGAPAELGLDPPSVTVAARVDGGPAFIVHFGARNPLGVARYARVAGSSEVALLPRHVADAWDRVAAGP